MARNAFTWEKRQKELAKKKKKEEKRARRQERKDTGGGGPEIAEVNEFGEVIEPPSDGQGDAAEEDETTA